MTSAPQMPVDFGVRQRGGTSSWQCHLPVPAELRHLYGGKRELRKTLGTKDPTEADRLARALCVEVFAQFERQLRELNPTRIDTLTPPMVAALVAAIRHDILHRDDLARFDLDGGPGLRHAWKSWGFDEQAAEGGPRLSDALAEVHAAIAEGLRLALADGDMQAARGIAEDAARKHLGFTVAWDRPENHGVLVKCLRAAVQAWDDRAARDSGEAIDTPEKPQAIQAPEKAKPSPRLRDVLAPWLKWDPDRNPKYVRAVETTLAAFESVIGNPPLVALTRAQGGDFRSWLIEQHESPKTASDKLGQIKTLLNFATDERELLPRNPWAKLAIKYPKGGTRTPWTSQEVAALFGSPTPRQERAEGDDSERKDPAKNFRRAEAPQRPAKELTRLKTQTARTPPRISRG